tara:strand:+ start:144 stop:311 length:168 start_codon:yes stop_codon:yes gene_type:complete
MFKSLLSPKAMLSNLNGGFTGKDNAPKKNSDSIAMVLQEYSDEMIVDLVKELSAY